MPNEITQSGTLGDWLAHEGFDLWGVSDASVFSDDMERYRQWLAKRYHGAMDFLERHLPFKYSPALLLKDCKSLLMVGLNYYQAPLFPDSAVPEGQGRVALYAWGRDYHKVLKKKLKQLAVKLQTLYPGAGFITGVDATPLSESKYTEQAGLGWRGKNTLIINPHFGSWILLGEILTTVPFSELQAQFSIKNVVRKANTGSLSARKSPPVGASCPAGCNLCQKACPTQALYEPYQLDASRCISYLTIEYKKEINPELWPGIQNWLFGCDICQRVCPFNKHPIQTKEQGFIKKISGGWLSLAMLLKIRNTEEYTQYFAGSPLMRAGRSKLLRNAIIVATNSRTQDLKMLINQLTSDVDPVIAWHAREALCFFS